MGLDAMILAYVSTSTVSVLLHPGGTVESPGAYQLYPGPTAGALI